MRGDAVLLVAGVAIVACVVLAWVRAATECEQRGGELVRGQFWFVCVEAKR